MAKFTVKIESDDQDVLPSGRRNCDAGVYYLSESGVRPYIPVQGLTLPSELRGQACVLVLDAHGQIAFSQAVEDFRPMGEKGNLGVNVRGQVSIGGVPMTFGGNLIQQGTGTPERAKQAAEHKALQAAKQATAAKRKDDYKALKAAHGGTIPADAYRAFKAASTITKTAADGTVTTLDAKGRPIVATA